MCRAGETALVPSSAWPASPHFTLFQPFSTIKKIKISPMDPIKLIKTYPKKLAPAHRNPIADYTMTIGRPYAKLILR
jgi:hypothetical protein